MNGSEIICRNTGIKYSNNIKKAAEFNHSTAFSYFSITAVALIFQI